MEGNQEVSALADACGAQLDVSSAASAASAQSGPSSFLAQLPRDALQGVVRRVSGCPASSLWKPFVNHRDLLGVLRLPGQTGELVRSFFTSLHAGDVTRASVPAHTVYSSDVVLDLGSPREGFQSLQRFLFVLNTSLQRLTLDLRRVRMPAFDFVCSNLRTLTLHGYDGLPGLDVLLRKSSGKLRELSIEGKGLPQTAVDAIAVHCAGLEKLKLAVETSEATMGSVWNTVGATLREVGVGKLSTTGLHSRGDALRIVEDDVALALSVGRLLETFRTTGAVRVSQRGLRNIFERCPTCVFDIHGGGYSGCVQEAMQFLGARTRALHLDRFTISNPSVPGDLTAACASIEALSLSSIRPALLDAIFRHPVPRLLRLDVAHADFESVASVFSGPFGHACVVEELTVFIPAEWKVAPDAAAKFARVAKCLRRVSIEEKVIHSRPMDDETDPWMIKRVRRIVAQYIRVFATVGTLKEVWIASVFLTERTLPVAEACEGMRGRGIDVLVGGVHYDPDAAT